MIGLFLMIICIELGFLFFMFMAHRLKTLERKFDAEERVAWGKLYTEYWTEIWPKQQMELYSKQLIYGKKRRET